MRYSTNSRDCLLAELLGCGFDDLHMLEDVTYDWCDILHNDWEGLFDELYKCCKVGNIGLNYIMRLVVRYGAEQMDQAVQDRVCELEAIPNERELDEDEETKLTQLQTLNPLQDIRGYYNGLDTHVWFEQNRDIYCRYFKDAMKAFEDGTGLWFEGID